MRCSVSLCRWSADDALPISGCDRPLRLRTLGKSHVPPRPENADTGQKKTPAACRLMFDRGLYQGLLFQDRPSGMEIPLELSPRQIAALDRSIIPTRMSTYLSAVLEDSQLGRGLHLIALDGLRIKMSATYRPTGANVVALIADESRADAEVTRSVL